MTGPTPVQTAAAHRNLVPLLDNLTAAITDMTRHLLPLVQRITADRQHLNATPGPRAAARKQATRQPSPGHTGPTTRPPAPQRIDATRTAPTHRRTHRYRRCR